MKPLIITGCQRSGTAYIAAVVTACGHWCSHERVFSDLREPVPRPETVEASWAAAPRLSTLDAHVVHQVRHPLAVIASSMARSTFAGKMRPSARWAYEQHPQIVRDSDRNHLVRAMRFWLEWNLLIEPHARHRWRVEDLTAEQVAQVLTGCGRPVDRDRAAQAMALIPRDVNHGHGVQLLSWSDLPACRLTRRLRKMAERYGYG